MLTPSYHNDYHWTKSPPSHAEGIIVASDVTQEWLLPWWWEHYQQHNTLPVAFVDLGLSHTMKLFCQEKGIYIHLASHWICDPSDLPQEKKDQWEKDFGKEFWDSRNSWFKKPLACLLSPFQNTLWMDLDCEVRGALSPLFALYPQLDSIAAAWTYTATPTSPSFNSGVLLFPRHLPFIEKWAKECIENNHLYPGDQDALNALIVQHNLCISPIPLIYNWSRRRGNNTDAKVVHWHGKHGKSIITHMIQKNLVFHEGL